MQPLIRGNMRWLVSLSSQLRFTSQSAAAVFKVLNVNVDTESAEFTTAKELSNQLETQYKTLQTTVLAGGGPKAIKRHTVLNKKLVVRERLKRILDPDTHFLELSLFAGAALEYGDIPAAGVISGVGKISGQTTLIVASDATVKGGTMFPISTKKHLRAQEIAELNNLPCLYMIDSGGAFLPLQAEIFLPGGRVFYNEAVMSSKGIPQVCIVCGSCTAGAAYVPTIADETIIVSNIGTIFLGGPPLVQAATGEVVTAEELGGAHMHSSQSGCTDHFVEDEEEGLELGRGIMATLNLSRRQVSVRDSQEPLQGTEDLMALILSNSENAMLKVISSLADGSQFQEFKVLFGSSIIAGFAFIHGYLVGIVANNGVITEEGAMKATHFVEICNKREIPLIFLQNFPSEDNPNVRTQSIKGVAAMMSAVACAEVPKITVVLGGSYGPESFAMCGRSFDPNFMFTWPSARIALSPAEQLTEQVHNAQLLASVDEDEKKAELGKIKEKLQKKYEAETSAFYGTARLWDDGMILPQDTRQVLLSSLEACLSYLPRRQTDQGVIRM